MQSFATLCKSLDGIGHVLREEPHVRTVALEGRVVELVRIRVGGVEWAAITVMVDASAPIAHDGLGALVRCRGRWALRLSLPVEQVSAATFAECMRRLALEAQAIASEPVGASPFTDAFAD